MDLIPACAPQVYSTPDTASVVRTFCDCKAARNLLNSATLIKPLIIRAHDYWVSMAETHCGADWAPTDAVIKIAEIHLNTDQGLDDLVFELYNIKRYPNPKIMNQASRGTLSMESFARSLEIAEYELDEHRNALKMNCKRIWNLPFETHYAKPTLEVHLFTQEAACHTDHYRRQWVEKFQKAYCAKHPEDQRSCQVDPKRLCDRSFADLTFDRKKLAVAKRKCELFSAAHPIVKKDENTLCLIRRECPQALSERDL